MYFQIKPFICTTADFRHQSPEINVVDYKYISVCASACGGGTDKIKVNNMKDKPLTIEKLSVSYVQEKYRYEMKTGKSRAFANLYSHLTPPFNKKEMINMIAAETTSYLRDYDPDSISVYNYDAWTKIDPSEWSFSSGYISLLRAGTLIPNGYFREKCLRLLIETKPLYYNSYNQDLHFIIRRINDNVPKIRRIAAEAAKKHIQKDEPRFLMNNMPDFERLLRCGRCNDVFDPDEIFPLLISRMTEDPAHISYCPEKSRRSCYNVIFLEKCRHNHNIRSLAEIFISNEKNGMLREMLVKNYITYYADEIQPDFMLTLMNDKYFKVRYNAYMFYREHFGMWDGFEKLLFENYPSIREFAEYFLKKNGFDCAAYCRANIPQGIRALAETGSAEDIPLIKRYLDEYPRECIAALTKLKAEGYEDLLWQYFCGSDLRTAKTAYKLIRSNKVYYPAEMLIENIEKAQTPELKWRIVKLLDKRGDWTIMPVLLKLLVEYSHLRPDITDKINSITLGKNRYSPHITSECAAKIRENLKGYEKLLSEKSRKVIEFELERAEK